MRKPVKNVVIIGASKGIGEALVREYSDTGAAVVMLSRDIAALKELADSIKARGGKAYYQRCDVTDREQVREALAYAKKNLGRLELVIINSGIGQPEWMKDFDSSLFKETMAVNAFGVAYVLEFLIPLLRKQAGGIIAGVSSMADVRGYPGSASYCASKAAMTRLLESARVELKGDNIPVITVRPGWVRTGMTIKNEFKMPFILDAGRAAKKIRIGIEKKKRVVQFPLPVLVMSHVAQILPPFLFDWIMVRLRKMPGER